MFIEEDGEQKKWCGDCKTYQPLHQFHRRLTGKEGRRCVECCKSRQYLRRYGITRAQYLEMNDDQAGRCAICGKPPKTRDLAVDHNHVTGKVRGLLCAPCNVGLVHVERRGWVEKARAYLEEYDGAS